MKKKRPLRIVTGNANQYSLRLLTSTDTSMNVVVGSLEWAANQNADAILFPGGYLRYRSQRHMTEMIHELHARTKHIPVTALVGWSGKYNAFYTAENEARTVKNGRFYDFVTVWGPKNPMNPRAPNEPMRYRQRFSNNENWKLADARWINTPRTITLGTSGRVAELLICGEVFCPLTKQAVGARAAELDALLVPAHVGQGLRHWLGLSTFAAKGIPSFTSLHNFGKNSMKQTWWPTASAPADKRALPSKVPGAVNMSTSDTHHVVEADANHRIEWVLWELP